MPLIVTHPNLTINIIQEIILYVLLNLIITYWQTSGVFDAENSLSKHPAEVVGWLLAACSNKKIKELTKLSHNFF